MRNCGIDSTKFKTIKAKTFLNHYKQDQINTCSLIHKYQIYILKETHIDRSKSNNNFDDNFKINLENKLKEIILVI